MPSGFEIRDCEVSISEAMFGARGGGKEVEVPTETYHSEVKRGIPGFLIVRMPGCSGQI
jgi:hypothetical protein